MDQHRLEIARLFHRFGFGPKPGEFQAAIKAGVRTTKETLLVRASKPGSVLPAPEVTDLGRRPEPNTPEVLEFSKSLRSQNQNLVLWWLDQMVHGDNQLEEKMIWFWHGHWATSVGKVNYALPMFNQNETFRRNALGDFRKFSQEMFLDGALQIWLDGSDNTVKAPNENLSREMMELFILGVNRYTETDVKELARAFTGYQIGRSSSNVVLNPRRKDNGAVTILGRTGILTPDEVISHLVDQENCGKFIAERIWYRFISSSKPLPANHLSVASFSQRNISSLVESLISGSDLSSVDNSMVKSPVEWFVAVCRALELTPSGLPSFAKINGYLEKLAQVPFSPPNVGGWPVDEAWLSSASAQFRIAFATWLTSQAKLTALAELHPEKRIAYLADLLGVVEWSARTASALREVRENPQRLTILAICSPEYVVSV
jgi:uncharacterized protein (DUF1800 family)